SSEEAIGLRSSTYSLFTIPVGTTLMDVRLSTLVQRQAQAQAEHERGETHVHEGRADGDGGPADDAADRRGDRDEQEEDELALHPLGRLGVTVRQPLRVRGQPGVLEALRHVRDGAGTLSGGQLASGAISTHEDLAPIHTA